VSTGGAALSCISRTPRHRARFDLSSSSYRWFAFFRAFAREVVGCCIATSEPYVRVNRTTLQILTRVHTDTVFANKFKRANISLARCITVACSHNNASAQKQGLSQADRVLHSPRTIHTTS